MVQSGDQKPYNLLLSALPAEERSALGGHLQELDLDIGRQVYDEDKPIEFVYFPHSCVISVQAVMQDGIAVETATVGREGIVGLPLFLGVQQTPRKAVCQVAGTAGRLPAAAFRAVTARSPHFQRILLRYTQAAMVQMSQSAACARLHAIEERCARWLLMTHDRGDGDSFMLTQESLGQMLGVRRPRVSMAAGILRQAGFIRYSRGLVRIVDRDGLESAACECYGVVAREYRHIFDDIANQ